MTLLRSIVFNAWFFGITFVLGIVGVIVRVAAPARALDFARMWARWVIAGVRVICGIHVRVTGLERLPSGAVLLASQHQSAFDTLIWAVLLPKVSYVYKAELERIPLFGPMLPAAGQIPLDRAASVTTVRRLLRATEHARDAGRQIVIFPEGTRVAVGADVPIRGGFTLIASRTAMPIYPVATDSGRFWGRRAFTKRPGCIQIHVCDPIPSDLPPPQLAAVLKQRWREANLAAEAVDNSVDRGTRTQATDHVEACFSGDERAR